MKVYKDIFTGDEMFSDKYKIKLVNDVIYEVTGKLIQRKDSDTQITGLDLSTMQTQDDNKEALENVVDIVVNHKLYETFVFGNKRTYIFHLKEYLKKVIAKLEEKEPEEVEVFRTNIVKVVKDIIGKFKNLHFFTGESMDVDGMVVLMEYRKIDGASVPVLMFFKDGLIEETIK